jgi:small subunit ribosomal protein S18
MNRIQRITKCRFCRAKVKEVDYKNVGDLQKLLTAQGKMFSRKRSGNCATHQRSLKKAIKRARYLALVPYVG